MHRRPIALARMLMNRSAVVGLALTLIALSCSSIDEPNSTDTSAADGSASVDSTQVPPSTLPTSSTSSTQPTTTDPEAEPAVELRVTNAFDPLAPGRYFTDLLPVEMEIDTTLELNVTRAYHGTVEMVGLGKGNDYFGLAFFEVDTLVLGDKNGRQHERLAASADLGPFLGRLAGSSIADSGSGALGGLEGEWWRITWPSADCCWEPLFQTTGWQNLWGHGAGYDQVIWAFDLGSALLVTVVEAPTDEFDNWAAQIDEGVFAGLTFGQPTGHTIQSPDGQPVGPYRVGRHETMFSDPTRTVAEVVADDGRVVVPAASERELLIGVTYPSQTGGHGAPMVAGPHPLVVSAHALYDAGLVLPPEHLLASHGYVVVTIRFPESSFPGNTPRGVLEQPADVSFVIDQVLSGALGDEFDSMIDGDRIGVVGASAGATTVYGLTASECCLDPRIGAAVAHAGTPYDFDLQEFGMPAATGTVPILHVGSTGDNVAQVDGLRMLHEAWQGESSMAVLEHVPHLGWLDPGTARFADSAALVTAFFDKYLKGHPVDLGDVAAAGGFGEFDQ